MNPNKNHREEIARALILCANVYLEMDSDSSEEDIDAYLVEDDNVDDTPPQNVSHASVSALSVPKWSGDQYKHFLKISRETFDFVYQLLALRLHRLCHGMPMVNARLQMMVALHKLTSSNTYRVASAAFNMKKSTGYNCTNRVVSALSALEPAFLQWPSRAGAAEAFEGLGGLPGAVGGVGCCRLPVLELLRGSKEGVMFQVTCDSKQKIIHCDITPPNTDLIQHSSLSEHLGDPTKFPDNSHLIANNAYPLHENIMVPYEEENNDIQSNFNKKLRSAYVVDKCIGSLLTRFESLTRGLSLNESANKRHVVACCVLHNICILNNDFCDGVAKLVEERTSSEACPKGVQKRDAIARELPMG